MPQSLLEKKEKNRFKSRLTRGGSLTLDEKKRFQELTGVDSDEWYQLWKKTPKPHKYDGRTSLGKFRTKLMLGGESSHQEQQPQSQSQTTVIPTTTDCSSVIEVSNSLAAVHNRLYKGQTKVGDAEMYKELTGRDASCLLRESNDTRKRRLEKARYKRRLKTGGTLTLEEQVRFRELTGKDPSSVPRINQEQSDRIKELQRLRWRISKGTAKPQDQARFKELSGKDAETFVKQRKERIDQSAVTA
ncbi:expressed unknown protein [Seminavis robusta]|uniref:Uncharacterized protein n=1 Tax=Seminavis robusta TaxID=568900 RepID=A0A9N8EGW3_9STRA|nr:expressed unknown protein [Seminavis robusta]|eukprot:Sro1062_g236910.1 n/a (245) ;mRNA; r:9122-9856